MIKRLNIYFKEMYPLAKRLFLALLLFFEIYFLVLLNKNITSITIGIPEFVGALTVFIFLMFLRIADDFKDYELDCRLFAHRPLPSGRVTKRDLRIILTIAIVIAVVLNFIFMNNILFFIALFGYGTLMSVWFFSKAKISSSLPLALVTHNPITLFINFYIISFVCIKYDLPIISYTTLLVALTLYFPSLIWEISRKTRAPKDETEYVTYSKLFGYKKPVNLVVGVMFFDMITTSLLLVNLNKFAVIIVILSYSWLVYKSIIFKRNPEQFKWGSAIERYVYITEVTVVAVEFLFLLRYVIWV